MEKLQNLQDDIAKWSDLTFGSDDRSIGILNHLKEEVDEVIDAKNLFKQNPTLINQKKMASEFADCLILILDAARKNQLNTNELIKAAKKKMDINKNRKWEQKNNKGYHKHQD